ncbi:MAG: hypothetical protein GY814_09020 [Gammaproteobacteria bacterium]|nr:hypothetical protein [Gammaproteobacteria bacterium]
MNKRVMTGMGRVTRWLWVSLAATLFLSGCSSQEGDASKTWGERKLRFEQAAQLAQPLVTAIDGYIAAIGRPPAKLTDITPEYIKRIPTTGLSECPDFDYRSFSNRPVRLVWFDLGSRQGAPMKKPAKFPDGDPEHAIMLFALDSEGRIVTASIDRLPKDMKGVDFDVARWKRKEERMLMALKLSDAYRLHGMPVAVFSELLGPHDGSRVIGNVPWELRINCSTGFLNRDVFFYWPKQKYPKQIYGGDVEAVADWAYVHD